jgi:hypothetical protein
MPMNPGNVPAGVLLTFFGAKNVSDQETKAGSAMADQWCLVELMGHQRMVGRVTETTVAGAGFLRIDVDAQEGASAFTRMVSPAAVYAINPVSEEVARALMLRMNQAPVHSYELKMLPVGTDQPTERDTQDHFDDDTDDDL